ncbi:phage holin family protein [Pontibacillus litoralis]|uniref:Membrane protein n=1 Tax=Pontibacillus litoralis JSM 072002 TaxID=1385512 RepID=A0A0A5HRD7_9BACI|nr:phage holin family protein [Pontibacillus litoralis]KGX86197.1 membrane protein [Pontibacillus litoralis JSM 072002]
MLKNWLLHIIVTTVVLIAVDQLFASFYLESVATAVLASFLLSILNVFVKPVLIIFTLPITVLSLGLFLFIINAITLMIAQAIMGSSFEISSFGMAIVCSFFISLLSLALNKLVDDIK